MNLAEAVDSNSRVKLKTNEGEKQKFLYVSSINDEYYGIKKVKKELIKIKIEEENIKIIKSKNKTSSFIGTTLLVLFTGLFLAYWWR